MKKGKWWSGAAITLAIIFIVSAPGAVEKIKFATTLKTSPAYFLPVVTAQEKGFWRDQALDAEWVPFNTSGDLARAMAAGAISLATSPASSTIQNAGRGLAVLIIADLEAYQLFYFYVRSDSAIRSPRDLRGARIGVSRLGSLMYAYSLAAAKLLALEKDLKIVAVGGVPQAMAALKAGAVDAIVLSPFTMALLEYQGAARRAGAMADFLPKEWDPQVIISDRDLVATKAEVVRRVVSAVVMAGRFIMSNPDWAAERIKSQLGWPDSLAREVYKLISYSRDGRMNPDSLAKMRQFLIEYRLVSQEKTPPVERLYTDKFVPVQ